MWQLEDIDENEISEIRPYPGLIGVLIYEPSSRKYECAIRNAYPELHIESDRHLLLIAGKSDWVSAEDRARMRADVRRTRDGEAMLEMIVSIAPVDRFKSARQMVTLQERFGIKRSEMPCLLLLADVDATEGIVYSFDAAVLQTDSDHAARSLTEVFDICKKAVAERPCTISGAQAKHDPKALRQLVDWRIETLGRVEPELNQAKLKRSIRRVAPAIIPAALRGLIGLA